MMTKIAQRLEQKRALQPQQILQATILQLNFFNLEERILEEFETNPALELVDEPPEPETENTTAEEGLDWEADDEYEPPNVTEKKERKEIPIPQKKDFVELLAEQLNLCVMDDTERSVAEEIIYNLDDNGYLVVDLELISDRFEIEIADVISILQKIQTFEPKGIAARNLKECLLLQINKSEHPTAFKLVNEHFEDIINHRYEHLFRQTRLSEHELQQTLDMISHLNPKPGAGHESIENQSVIPELIVAERDGHWVIVVNDNWLPDLQVSNEYVEMLAGQLDNKVRSFIKEKVDSAAWFVNAISERRKTLTMVMKSIIARQPEFFNGNVVQLQPMKLQNIADELDLDISTISRSTRGKYVDTPYGIFELKSFFTEGILTASGEEISTLQIKQYLKETIASEDKHNPYTDNQLKNLMNEKGYPVARRTVAKYREQLNLPVARLRKQLT